MPNRKPVSKHYSLKILQIREPTATEIKSPDDIHKLMRRESKADRECFWVLHMSVRNTLIEKELVSIGCLDSAVVHPREVFRKAIMNSSSGIITVHNHPSGNTDPSQPDIQLFNRLKQAGEIIPGLFFCR